MIVRPATAADADGVAGLEERNLGRDAWSHGLVAEGVSGSLPTVTFLVAEAGGELVGYAAVSVVQDTAELQRIAVDHAHRRQGLATALLDTVLTTAAEGGADRLLLEVRDDNLGATAFYADRGFTEIHRRQGYYRDGATAVVMVRQLRGPAENVWTTS